MARTVRDTALETRTARARLAVRGEPYWKQLDGGLALGYRRKKSGGSWLARRWDGERKRYTEHALGSTDDVQDADGAAHLSFSQAQAAARGWFQEEERRALGLSASAGPYTVGDACDDYIAHYVGKGGRSEYATRRVIEIHIRPSLGGVELAKLTTRRIRDWHRGIATAPKMVRTKSTAKERATRAVDHDDMDAVRSRRATANRILTVLKAALNHAWHERHIGSDEAWRAVKPFAAVDAPVIRYLKPAECTRLVNACAEPLRSLVRGALLTGARYSELARLKVVDIDLDARTAAVREAKGGKPRHIVLTDEATALFRSLTHGKDGSALVFARDDGGPWKPAQQTRPLAEACAAAKIVPAIGFHVLRHTHASTLAMAGVPMGVIAAQLGHADTRITEKHYAHLAPSYVADTIRAAFPKLGIVPESNVKELAPKKG